MAFSHTRQSPGVEFKEIDRSQYDNKPNYSIVGTASLILGFADKGETYTTQWINSKNTLIDQFGYPKNEPERYFFNAITEILNRGGVCYASRLPYDNISNKDYGQFVQTCYRLNRSNCNTVYSDISGTVLNQLSSADPSLTSYIEIKLSPNANSLINTDRLDDLRTGKAIMPNDSITVVDITRRQYGKTDFQVTASGNQPVVCSDVEVLGYFPAIVTPANAMFYQGVISSETTIDEHGFEHTANISAYTPFGDLKSRSDVPSISGFSLNAMDRKNRLIEISSDSINEDTVSKQAVGFFPVLKFTEFNRLERQNLKKIGLVVFQVFRDPANENKLNYAPVEYYIGALDKKSRDSVTGASDYIGDIINANSKFVNFFSNIRTNKDFEDAATFYSSGIDLHSTGFVESECEKEIDYVKSIIQPMNIILDRLQDPNQVQIDLVVDAGVSNIAQFVKMFNKQLTCPYGGQPCECQDHNSQLYPFPPQGYTWGISSSEIGAWKTVIQKFNDFCKNVRKDCMFIADGLRPFCLDGDEKNVRPTKLSNTIQTAVSPKLRYMSGVDSSYSAGYCDWFMTVDDYSGDFFWCPPSIKAAGVYTYTDAYYHQWDAPAGLTRGHVSAVDVAFNPRNDEAGVIYQQAWNYAVNYPHEGVVIEGQKTMQLQPTSLDRVNVRRLMLHIEKQVCRVSRRFLYEGNTAYNRQRFTDSAVQILESVKAGNGIIDYAIRCDDTNNTPETIDRNELHCTIAVKPVKTIEWIVLNFITTNQSANVQEEVVRN